MTKKLLIVSALLEMVTGLALIATPALPISLLLGASQAESVTLVLGRVLGGALFSLGLACWLARRDAASQAGRAVIAALLVYNVAISAVLVHARLGIGLSGAGLWPAALLHAGLAGWCIVGLTRPVASR